MKQNLKVPVLMEFIFIYPTEKPREACFDPGNIMNGTRIGTDLKLGSTVTYQCDSGYKIADPSSITCVIGADGKPAWDRVLPSCNGRWGPRPAATACLPSVVSRAPGLPPAKGLTSLHHWIDWALALLLVFWKGCYFSVT